MVQVIHQDKGNLYRNIKDVELFLHKDSPHPRHTLSSVTQLSPWYLYENMQYNYILLPRATLAFEQDPYTVCYFSKNHFPKTALWESEASKN